MSHGSCWVILYTQSFAKTLLQLLTWRHTVQSLNKGLFIYWCEAFKGVAHLKMKILALHTCMTSTEHKRRYLEEFWLPSILNPIKLPLYGHKTKIPSFVFVFHRRVIQVLSNMSVNQLQNLYFWVNKQLVKKYMNEGYSYVCACKCLEL